MNQNKVISRFFKLTAPRYCPLCKEKDDTKSLIERSIDITITSPFDMDYASVFIWEYIPTEHYFKLRLKFANETPGGNPIFYDEYNLSNIDDLQTACILLNNLNLKVIETRLQYYCINDFCKFKHVIELMWVKESKNFSLDEEWIRINDYSLYKDYNRSLSTISEHLSPFETYNFNFILNITMNHYNKITKKINQTLLLG